MTHPTSALEIRQALYNALVRRWKEDEEYLSKCLAALIARMADENFVAWVRTGMACNYIDEEDYTDFLKNVIKNVEKTSPTKKRRIEESDNRLTTREDETEDDSVFKAPSSVSRAASQYERMKATDAMAANIRREEQYKERQRTLSSNSIADTVKTNNRRNSAASTTTTKSVIPTLVPSTIVRQSSVSSYVIDSDEDDEDDDEIESVQTKIPPVHTVKDTADIGSTKTRRFWCMVLELDNKKCSDVYPAYSISATYSTNGRTQYVLGVQRPPGDFKKSYCRYVMIITDGTQVNAKKIKTEARAFFRAGTQYRPDSCYFNVSDVSGVEKPIDMFGRMVPDGNTTLIGKIREILQTSTI